MFQRFALAKLLFVAIAASSFFTNWTFDIPCVPIDGSITVDFARPHPAHGNGHWASDEGTTNETGCPNAKESDYFSDDEMGAAAPAGSPPGSIAKVKIDNNHGNLSGPNGVAQNNGGGQGSCIEVYVEWTYWYQVTKTTTTSPNSFTLQNGNFHYKPGSTVVSTTVVEWVSEKLYSGTVVVCPCSCACGHH